jgi:hypothetical protein
MIELVALAPEDGWAYIRRDGAYSLVRPPYRNTHLVPIDKSAVASAVTKHGFVAADETFADMPALVEHMRSHLREAHPDLPSAEELQMRHWKAAGADALEHALARVEDEFLPGGKYDHAMRLVTAMMQHSPVLREDGDLMRRGASLLADVTRAQEVAERELTAPDLAATPRAHDRYGDVPASMTDFVPWRLGDSARV